MKIVKFLVVVFFISEMVHAGGPTPVMFTDFKDDIDLENAVQWTKPVYSGQEDRLGYVASDFVMLPGMEEKVQFWLNIYTKYTTDQGVLHDSRYVHLVYEEVDFGDIMENSNLTDGQKSKARRKRVDQAKTRIKEQILRTKKIRSAEGLSGEDLRYWKMFNMVDEKRKFRNATRKGRLRFQLGQKDRFVKGIFYSGRYLKKIEEIFEEQNLPKELTRLPLVESSFNFKAKSRVGASGIWQFMRSSGRKYMKINATVDERNEPVKATEAAAKMLKANFKMLGNWPLAVTGYNHGPYGMRRMVKKYKTSDLHEMIRIRKGRFGFASANFYASFLAALEAEKNANKYYGIVYREKPLAFQKLVLSKAINNKTLLEWFAGDRGLAQRYNPHLSSSFWKGYRFLKRKRYVKLPPDRFLAAQESMKTLGEQTLDASQTLTYKISKGDTLGEIAQNFGVSIRALKQINGIDNPRRIRAGQKLIIPKP